MNNSPHQPESRSVSDIAEDLKRLEEHWKAEKQRLYDHLLSSTEGEAPVGGPPYTRDLG